MITPLSFRKTTKHVVKYRMSKRKAKSIGAMDELINEIKSVEDVVTEPENNPKNGMQWVMYDTVWEMSLLNNWSSCKLSERQLLGTINSHPSKTSVN